MVGPTAAGKSALAVGLALALGGEVINADSMQLYRGMDIGTAKLTAQERRGVPHHLLDIWDVRQAASVADYQRLARAVIDRRHRARPGTDPGRRVRPVHSRGPRRPELPRHRPGRPRAPRNRTGRRGRRRPAHPAGRPRPGRGRGDPAQQRPPDRPRAGGDRDLRPPLYRDAPGVRVVPPRRVQIGVRVPREELDRRIAARVDAMWQAGFEDEVRRLERDGLREGRTASRALGYAQMLRHLAGEWTLEQARDGDHPGHPPVRPPPGILVPPRPPHHLARRRSPAMTADPFSARRSPPSPRCRNRKGLPVPLPDRPAHISPRCGRGSSRPMPGLARRQAAGVPARIRGRVVPRSHNARTIAALASNPGCARGQPHRGWPRKATELRPKPQSLSRLPSAYTLLLILQWSRRLW